MTWQPATAAPARADYYAVRFTWSDAPAIGFYSPRDGWRLNGRRLHGLDLWLDLPSVPRTPAAKARSSL